MGVYDIWIKPFTAQSFSYQFLFLLDDLLRGGLILVNFTHTNFKSSLFH